MQNRDLKRTETGSATKFSQPFWYEASQEFRKILGVGSELNPPLLPKTDH